MASQTITLPKLMEATWEGEGGCRRGGGICEFTFKKNMIGEYVDILGVYAHKPKPKISNMPHKGWDIPGRNQTEAH